MSDKSELKARDGFFGRVNKAVEADEVYQEAVEAIRRAKTSIMLVATREARQEMARSSGLSEDELAHEPGKAIEVMSERLGYSGPGILKVAVDNAIARANRKTY